MKKLFLILAILACLGAKSQTVIDLSNPNYWINATISGTLTANNVNITGIVNCENIGAETNTADTIFVDAIYQNGVYSYFYNAHRGRSCETAYLYKLC